MNALVLLSGLVLVLTPLIAQAQSKCDAGKRMAYAKQVLCLAKVDAKADTLGVPADPAKEQKCIDKSAVKCAKAESKGDCTDAVKGCAGLMTEADACREAVECSSCGSIALGLDLDACYANGPCSTGCETTASCAAWNAFVTCMGPVSTSGESDLQVTCDCIAACNSDFGGLLCYACMQRAQVTCAVESTTCGAN